MDYNLLPPLDHWDNKYTLSGLDFVSQYVLCKKQFDFQIAA